MTEISPQGVAPSPRYVVGLETMVTVDLSTINHGNYRYIYNIKPYIDIGVIGTNFANELGHHLATDQKMVV